MTSTLFPSIRKARQIIGRTLSFRDATQNDAEFILSLRTDEKKSRFLSAVSGDLDVQLTWLKEYAESLDQAYFIIEYKNEPIGTVRIYDPQEYSFCWGSWILQDSRPSHAAMESALMVYSYAIDHLCFQRAHFAVHRANQRVCQFHERFGAERIEEASSELELLYSISLPAIKNSRNRYERFLPERVVVCM